MATATSQYEPDYAVPPGWVLKDRLDAQGMTPAELARRCGRSAKLISEIVAGKAPIEPRTALQFEKVLGVDAEIWLGIETDYRLQRTRARPRPTRRWPTPRGPGPSRSASWRSGASSRRPVRIRYQRCCRFSAWLR